MVQQQTHAMAVEPSDAEIQSAMAGKLTFRVCLKVCILAVLEGKTLEAISYSCPLS